MYVIGISGKLGSGKNFIATKLKELFQTKNKNVMEIAFADYLKTICSIKDNISYEELFKDKSEKSRLALQTRGNEERKIDPNVFIKAIDVNLKMLEDKKFDIVLITDLRFENELNYLNSLKDRYKVFSIRIHAPNRSYEKLVKEFKTQDKNKLSIIQSHQSEVDLDNIKDFSFKIFNEVCNASNIDFELNNIVNKILQ